VINYINSSIGKKQIIGLTGIMMVFFIAIHLTGNFLIFKEPDAINEYSVFLHDLGFLLWIARIGLILTFFLHFGLTARLVIENKRARETSYKGPVVLKKRSFSTRVMPYTGTILLSYIVLHLFDFTFTSPSLLNATVNGEMLGLYGLIYNSFLNPLRVIFYVLAMFSLGFHLTHGIQSFVQTMGAVSMKGLIQWKRFAVMLGLFFSIAYSSIPFYILYIHYVK